MDSKILRVVLYIVLTLTIGLILFNYYYNIIDIWTVIGVLFVLAPLLYTVYFFLTKQKNWILLVLFLISEGFIIYYLYFYHIANSQTIVETFYYIWPVYNVYIVAIYSYLLGSKLQ